ncbi:MAG TPA: hypothetical protein VGL99_06080 [Chloroflexota bacterium]
MFGVRLVVLACLSLLVVGGVRADPSSPWLPGPDASGDDTYAGFVDAPAVGQTVSTTAAFEVRGWVVDQTASGWAGIDQVQVYAGLMNQGGHKLADAVIVLDRPDVAAALGNPFFAASGFAASVPPGALPVGTGTLSVYTHSPSRGWWYRTLDVQVSATAQAPAPVAVPLARPFSDDPLLVVEAPLPDEVIASSVSTFVVHGFAIDRNTEPNAGIGNSGVSRVQIYLDGGRRDGTFIGDAQLGKSSREATGYGPRWNTSGWEFGFHPNDFAEEPHALFIYAVSAAPTANETLVIVPIRITSGR